MDNIAILASGSGTNAEAIVRYFAQNEHVNVSCIVSNKAQVGVHERASRLGIPSYTFTNQEMREGTLPLKQLLAHDISLVVLAGYMNMITEPWLQTYPHRIINIHPALLPNYGGKGMYGHHVHEAVISNKEQISGITIHLVDEEYDHGRHLLQATCPVLPTDTADSLAERIHVLEHRFFPVAIEQYLLGELKETIA